MGVIKFNQLDVKLQLKDRNSLKVYLNSIFTREGIKLKRLNYVFCNDAYLLSLNLQYLHHDTLTDILTFPLSSPGAPVEAEIYISIERVRENARIHQATFENELHRVMIHGILHLCGYDDHSPAEKAVIRKKEDLYLIRERS